MADAVASLDEARARRRRELLYSRDRWTGREALEAAIADIDAGELDPDAICVIYACRGPSGSTKVGRYVGAVSERGVREGLWIIGAVSKALTDWMRGD